MSDSISPRNSEKKDCYACDWLKNPDPRGLYGPPRPGVTFPFTPSNSSNSSNSN